MARKTTRTTLEVKISGLFAGKLVHESETDSGCASDGVTIDGTATDVTNDPKRIEKSHSLPQPVADRLKKSSQ
ncbi:MAG: hypothetical protein IAE87_09485 [Rhodobacteraceae bacterium]|nr:hypothetical protein [Paracoccaceae bacterium]